MKVFAISDLHLSINNPKPMDIFGPAWDNYVDTIFEYWKQKVGPDDVVIIAGDISWAMNLDDAVSDINLIAQNSGKKIIIRGNHDYWWGTISKVRSILPDNFFAIQNDAIKIGDKVFCGSRAWSMVEKGEPLEEDKKIIDRELIRLRMSFEMAKKLATDGEEIIAILHYPPFNSKREDSVFTSLIEEFGIKTVVYGHLHGAQCKADILVEKNGVKYYLTSCDKLGNKLIEIK